jgi:hypothetical protein
MRALGYNTIRVSLDLCRFECLGTAQRIDPRLLDNIAALLRMARAKKVVVLLTLNEWDSFVGYRSKLPCCEVFDGSFNRLFLTKEGVRATTLYFADLIQGLKARRAPFEAILAYELRNEQFYDAQLPPFSLTSGTVRTANGKTYDMVNQAAKDRMADEGLLHYIKKVRQAIKKLDPAALVTMGWHPPLEDVPERLVRTQSAFARSTLDFLDLHLAPGQNAPFLLEYLATTMRFAGQKRKPMIIGEVAAFKFLHASPTAAIPRLQEWQVVSCDYGFDGWLLWLWAPTDEEVWTGLEEDGVINRALSPAQRPDPCSYGKSSTQNLAGGRPATATQSYPDNPPALAVDTNVTTSWVAGGFPPQSIEIDLGGPKTIFEIALHVSQLNEGETVHRIWSREESGPESLLAEVRGATHEGQWLSVREGAPWNGVHFVRVETVSGASWPAWREILVIGPREL